MKNPLIRTKNLSNEQFLHLLTLSGRTIKEDTYEGLADITQFYVTSRGTLAISWWHHIPTDCGRQEFITYDDFIGAWQQFKLMRLL